MAEKMRGAAEGGASAQAAVGDTAGYETARRAFGDLWSSATELSATLARSVGKADGANPVVAEMLAKIFDPRAWLAGTNDMDEALQKMAEGPRLSDLWNVECKFLAVSNAWVALRRRTLEHNRVMLDAWMRAAGGFAHELNQRTERKEPLASWREVLALWVETANEVLLETQRSEMFLKSQREVLKASTDLRLAQRELAEYYSEMFGYPTRAELDDVHKTVTELRRELRALRRGRGDTGEATAPTAARKRAAGKRKETTP